ncbi:hypothetical protein [Streptococcus himalayensis]|uniref:Uncharacterized protein n=1 Tax=Streptococcus himalayensis TaxID=1888195 RepID=A0A917A895_9STRE|nr:hypothetical protein [Streptococcus himalayensis]GGE30185.1 hypothetical protein GCM10011510_09270 [Streptococcus himalayensis]
MKKEPMSLLKKIGWLLLILIFFPFVVLLSPVGVWYFSKKKPDTLKRNISIGLSVLALAGAFSVVTNPETYLRSPQREQSKHLISSTSSSSTKEDEHKKAQEKKKELEDAKKAEEVKKKAEETKKAEEAKKKVEEAKKAAEEKKRVEEAAKKAEEERLTAEGETAVQNLEANQVTDNIEATQGAINKLADSPKKAELQQRLQAVQTAIAQREEEARREQEAQAAAERAAQLSAQQEQRIVYVARNGNSDAYWYSLSNMPSNTRFDRVVQMSEAQAISLGKHPAKGHG